MTQPVWLSQLITRSRTPSPTQSTHSIPHSPIQPPFTDARDSVQDCQGDNWDLIVVDYVMPELNGIETISSIPEQILQKSPLLMLR